MKGLIALRWDIPLFTKNYNIISRSQIYGRVFSGAGRKVSGLRT
ncbi:hypothetical protein FHS68_000921 [Dyadobacter arcticus]|uniref:Uncharacterized protein n=1 Tax=Dyadobacter arcticus TaxID=1078754 RepID=A0ABX0UJL1_9BACT|nr:hypothetical protein [Dyadobacter arcticus]